MGIQYPSGEDGLRKKAEYYDKDYTEVRARQKVFDAYRPHYDKISETVERRNKGLKLWGPEEDAAVKGEVEAEMVANLPQPRWGGAA